MMGTIAKDGDTGHWSTQKMEPPRFSWRLLFCLDDTRYMEKSELQRQVADARLKQLESIVQTSLEKMIDGCVALMQIRDDALYKAAGFATFDLYVEQRWNLKRRDAYRYIDAAKVKQCLQDSNVQNLHKLTSLGQYTELSKFSDDTDQLIAVYDKTIDAAGDGKITAALIRQSAAAVSGQPTFDSDLYIEPHEEKLEAPASASTEPQQSTKPPAREFPCTVCNGRGKVKARPICKVCSRKKGQPVFMKAGSSPGALSYYYCPNAHCKETQKVPRPETTSRQIIGNERR